MSFHASIMVDFDNLCIDKLEDENINFLANPSPEAIETEDVLDDENVNTELPDTPNENDEHKGKCEGCDKLEETYENQNNKLMKANKELQMMKMENECKSKESEKALKSFKGTLYPHTELTLNYFTPTYYTNSPRDGIEAYPNNRRVFVNVIHVRVGPISGYDFDLAQAIGELSNLICKVHPTL
ncbi:hypothetical protein L2E82_01006 [Cichorium intybus]|uniref:Uncharacterized protein n=1 Tax=Cichorium intybus TaxID=13427 RepID=A0ACB9GYX5_CICIN|nr:hypothetical protein L2E82_01006 [Cichorium intybus]